MPDTKRCPMCGNSNPADAEVCPHCQAQLKPIIGDAKPSESSVPPAEGRDEMDWLRNLTGADESPPTENEPEDNEPVPQDESYLLNRINLSSTPAVKDDAPKLSSAFTLPKDQEEEGNADWLRILEESSTRKENAAHTLPEEDHSDLDAWLENLGSTDAPPAAPQPETPVKQTPPKKLTERLKEERLAQNEPKQGDWMNTLRKESPEEAELKTSQPTDPSSVFTSSSVDKTGSLLGWLDDETPFSDSLKAAENADLPDWLNDETSEQETSGSILPDLPMEEEQPAQAANLPDWLRGMAPPETALPTPTPSKPLVSADHDDLHSWLQDETEDTAADMLNFSSGDDMSDLLSGLQTEEKPAAQTPSAPVNDIFALNTEEKSSSPFPFGGNLPIEKDDSFEEDDLIGIPPAIKDNAPAEDSAHLKNIPLGNGEDLPDWLKEESPATRGDSFAGAEAAPFAASPFTDEPSSDSTDPFDSSLPFKDEAGVPDWLTDASPAALDESPADEAAPFAASPFKDETASGSVDPFDSSLPFGEESSLPNWLTDASPAALDESPADEAAPFAASPFKEETASGSVDPFDSSLPFEEEADLPDWLTSDQAPTEEASTDEEIPAAEAPAFRSSPFLDNLAAKDAAPFGDVAPFGDLASSEKENLFRNIAPFDSDEHGTMDSEPAPAGDEHPFAVDNMPDWLESEEASQIMPEQTGTNESADNLSPAQLPGWLAAMRPVESVAIDNGGNLNEHIEKSGPLAGLRGVLPVDMQAIKYRKPPVYSVKLNVTETQAAHAGLMEDLLERENKPSEVKRVGTQGSKRLMQLVVALVLIVVLVLFRSAGSIPDIPGRPYLSPFVTSFFNETEILPSESAVLLAVDYEPGYSGELKAASNSAIQRLMSKQQRIAVVSTVPAGPALAEDLLLQAYLGQQDSDPEYMNTHTINLGYLPGGITSLKEFALRPQQAAHYGLTTQYDGLIPWDHPALTGVTKLTDFAAVIVITDSVESGRAWVEQVQPSLGSTPMLLISSAQSAPMLEPYVQSGQLSGMLSGLGGSVSYENLLQQPGTGQSYWIALQGGLAVVVALILVGILLELFVTLVASRRTQSED